MKLPDPIHTDSALIYSAWESMQDSSHRPHLGASVIGHHCNRYLWLLFRHAASKRWPGRMLRLFDTGKREEARIHEDLRRIGVEVHADDGSAQYRVTAVNGHFGGSMDGVITKYHRAPKQWVVLECKTHSDKSFKDLVAKGVAESKPMHYAQCQVYVGLTGMRHALYFAVNKNTDDIHTEFIDFDADAYGKLLKRAETIINDSLPPARCSADPTWWQCKSCDYYSLCHSTETPEVNCRTCAHSTPVADGKWSCAMHGMANGTCDSHRYIPVFLENFAEVVDANQDGNFVMYRGKSGNLFTNGAYSSQEIHDCKDKSMLGDKKIDEVKRVFGAKVNG